MLQELLKLMRPTHYIKNGLVAVPLIFSGQLFMEQKAVETLAAILVFSLVASVIYIVNDTRDATKDRLHPTKRSRPIASGNVSPVTAMVFASLLLAISVGIGIIFSFSLLSWILLAIYLFINIAYSMGLKNVPIVDISILAFGFIIRVLFGASVINVIVTQWLYLTVLASAFYLSLGKRRNEIARHGSKSRKVNEFYSLAFLDKNMYVCSGIALVFYSLWATLAQTSDSLMYLSIPLVVLLFMTYSLAVEKDSSSGDPVEVTLKNKGLLALATLCIIVTLALVYI